MDMTRRTFVKAGAVVAGGTYLGVKYGVPQLADLGLIDRAHGQGLPLVEDWVNTACWIGKQDCGIRARRIDGRVVQLEGHPDHPRNLGTLCPKGVAQIHDLYDPSRLTDPLIRTNAKGRHGTWRTASWDEALTIVAEKFSATIAKDKRLAVGCEGRAGKVGPIYNEAFPKAVGMGPVYGRRGNDCGGASEDSTLATWGDRSAISPDLRDCRYLICYWSLTQAGGPSMCQITYPRMVKEAKERGMKVVAINPYDRPVAHFADEWVPIKPGTDMAFWLAILHELLANGFVDEPFLKQHTNAPSLVKADGTLLRDADGAELVWDLATKQAATYADATDPALTGVFRVGTESVRPSFEALKGHVSTNTPEWAADVTGLPAEQIRHIARDLGENARIGSTTVVDGVTVPYRPVAYGIHATATKFHGAIQTNRAILLSFMVLGAIEAVGGPHLWSKKTSDPAKVHAGWVANAGKDQGDRLDRGNTRWFPLGAGGYHMIPEVVNDPEKYGLPYKPEDMFMLFYFVNPIITSRPWDKVLKAWSKFGYAVSITPYLTASSDYCADVVLPCGTLDKWEGPLGVKTLYESADTIRAPLMAPLGNSRSETEIFADLAEKMGKLYGEKGFIDQINGNLGIKDPHKLPLDRKPTPQDVLQAWTQSKHGLSLDEFMEKGVVKKNVAADKQYLNSGPNPFGGVRGAFYIEAFETIRETIKAKGTPESIWRFFSAFPHWEDMWIDQSPPKYDLYLMDFKRIEHKQSRTQQNRLLKELMPGNPLIMNAATARAKGLKEGDRVRVESYDPVTKQTRHIETKLTIIEGIRPDSVGLTHHVSTLEEPSVNALIPYSDGFWDMGGGWFSHIKVNVTKMGGDRS